MFDIYGPKFLRSRADRGASHADAKWVLRLLFFNGYYIHIGKQRGRTEELSAYRNALNETMMRVNFDHYQE